MIEISALHKLILERIYRAGQLTFPEFMQMALYEPGLGYYTRQPNLIGARGDFYTAPHLTPVFGELLARQLAACWEQLGQPANFQLVEMGAGQGVLAGDILGWFYRNRPESWPTLTYTIVEVSEFLIQGQRRRLQAVGQSLGGLDLLAHVVWRDLANIEDAEITGICLSNELVDAFPVHLVQLEGGKLVEIYVVADASGQLLEQIGPLSTTDLANYFEGLGLDLTDGSYPEGYRTEVNLAAPLWLAQVAAKLKHGYVLTIDYGYTAARRFSPYRSQGTLQCYFNHTINHNPYLRVGGQDITTHVDFSSLMLTGERNGLKTESFETQAEFLTRWGIAEKFIELSAEGSDRSPNERMTEHAALLKLISPTEMGNFGVLLQSKE